MSLRTASCLHETYSLCIFWCYDSLASFNQILQNTQFPDSEESLHFELWQPLPEVHFHGEIWNVSAVAKLAGIKPKGDATTEDITQLWAMEFGSFPRPVPKLQCNSRVYSGYVLYGGIEVPISYPYDMIELSWSLEVSQCSWFDFSAAFRRTNTDFIDFEIFPLTKWMQLKRDLLNDHPVLHATECVHSSEFNLVTLLFRDLF